MQSRQLTRPSVIVSLSLCGALLGSAPANADSILIPVSSQAMTHAEANAGAGLIVDDHALSQGNVLNPLAVSSQANAVNGVATVLTTAATTAQWANSDSLLVTMTNLGWTTANVTNGRAAFNVVVSYQFLASQGSVLAVTLHGSASGSDLFGLQGWRYTLRDDLGNSLQSTFGLNVNVTQLRTLQGGHTYTAEFSTFFGVNDIPSINGGLGTRDAHQSATFDLSVQAIPAPPGAVLGLIGVACLLAWRRQRAFQVCANSSYAVS
jgi:MYXO-CTERM domain-containing protein